KAALGTQAMNHCATVKHLIRDTFRQARASGISWMMLGVTALCVVLCLSVKVSGDLALHGNDETPLFLPPTSPRAVVPSVVLVLGTSGPLETLTLSAMSNKVWFSLEANPALARREGID